MRVGVIISDVGDDFLRFLQQYGVTDIVGGFNTMHDFKRKFPPDAGDQPGCHWDYSELLQLRERVEAFGMRLASMENPHPSWCFDHVMLGLPGHRLIRRDRCA